MSTTDQPTIPTEKGAVPVTEASDQLLTQFNKWFDDLPADDKRRTKYAELSAAVKAELAERTAPAEEKPAEQSEALATTAPDAKELAAITRVTKPDAITARLEEMQKKFHLVAPATHIDMLPEGFGVSVSMVHVDPADCYAIGWGDNAKLGLGKTTLEQIWRAAGGTWDPSLTRRLDNGRDPRYAHFRAVGTVRNFDGMPGMVSGEVEMDAREGSDLINEIVTKAKERESKANYKGRKDGGASQILELRKFLLRHAESKAKNRAIASMGVKRAYTKKELEKPFAVAKLTFTGRTDNPVLAEKFALMSAEAALTGGLSLYGHSARQLPAAPPDGHEPPPVGGGFVDEDDTDGDEKFVDTDGETEGEPKL